MTDYEVQEDVREVLFGKYGANGVDMVSHLEEMVNDGKSTPEKADDVVKTLVNIKPALRQFLYPIFGGNEGIVNMFVLEDTDYEFFNNFELLRDSETGKSYLICNDVIENHFLIHNPATYIDQIYQLVDEGTVEIHELLSEKHLLVCSREHTPENNVFRNKLSPHSKDIVLNDKIYDEGSKKYVERTKVKKDPPVFLHLTEKGTHFP